MNKKLTTSLVASLLIATNLTASQTLDTITVTSATKSEQSIKDVTSNVEVITSQEIEEKHFSTVNEALNTIAGIDIISNGGMGKSSSVKLRGFDSKRVLVLIDGVRYNDVTSSGGAPFEHLIISNIEQIEVIKGAQSGIWGADASAGVINIITKKAKNGFNNHINLEYGSFNTKKYKLTSSYKNDKYSILGSISGINSDGFSAQAPRGVNVDDLEDDLYENVTGTLKARYNFNDNNQIELSHMVINAESKYDGCENKTWNPAFGGYYSCTDSDIDKANGTTYTSKTDDTFSSIKYNVSLESTETTFFINRSVFDREYSNSTNFTGGAKDGTAELTKSEYDGVVNEYGFKSDISYGENSTFIFGFDYKNFKHDNDISNKYNNRSVYLTNINKFNDDRTIFTQSLRYDEYSKFDNKTTGKIGIKQFINDDLNVSSNYGTSYNVPSLYTLYSDYGNDKINPETTKSFDVSVSYKNFDLTYFDNRITDMIEYDGSVRKFNNLEGESRIKGIELNYSNEIYSDTVLSFNYTYLQAKDDEDEDLQRRAKEAVKIAVDYYGINKLHLNLNANYVGDRVQYAYGTHTVNAETGNYTLWNTVVNYEINKDLSTYLKVDNITDKYYQTVDGYATAGRSAYVGLNYKF